jgi:hypothetical protein
MHAHWLAGQFEAIERLDPLKRRIEQLPQLWRAINFEYGTKDDRSVERSPLDRF